MSEPYVTESPHFYVVVFDKTDQKQEAAWILLMAELEHQKVSNLPSTNSYRQT